MIFTYTILVLLLTLIFLLCHCIKKNNSYFEELKIPYIRPWPLIGNLKSMLFFEKCPILAFDDFYKYAASKSLPFVGIYMLHKPVLLIRDLELIKRILVKDFNYFSNRGGCPDPHSDAIGANNLFFVKNPAWKVIRTSLSPFFSSGKLKNCAPLIQEVANELKIHLDKMFEKRTPNWDGVEFKELCSLYTTDVIATVAFGVNANSIKNPNGEFRKNGARLMKFTWIRNIELMMVLLFPKLVKIFKAKLFCGESNHFLRSSMEYVLSEREKSQIKRNDLIDMLLELKRSGKPIDSDLKFEGDVLTAQAAFFFLAGFETSSAMFSFSLYNLAKNPEIQKKACEEIESSLAKHNGQLTYDAIAEMEYLTAIIYENSRLYPVLPFLDRECTPPSGEEGYSLEPFSDFVIPKDMVVYIPIYSLHRDPQFFPNPDTFDPERFLPKNMGNMESAAFVGFGLGPRYCVGKRLGLLQVQIGLITVLRNFFVQPSPKTPEILVFDVKAVNTQIKGGLYLDFVKKNA